MSMNATRLLAPSAVLSVSLPSRTATVCVLSSQRAPYRPDRPLPFGVRLVLVVGDLPQAQQQGVRHLGQSFVRHAAAQVVDLAAPGCTWGLSYGVSRGAGGTGFARADGTVPTESFPAAAVRLRFRGCRPSARRRPSAPRSSPDPVPTPPRTPPRPARRAGQPGGARSPPARWAAGRTEALPQSLRRPQQPRRLLRAQRASALRLDRPRQPLQRLGDAVLVAQLPEYHQTLLMERTRRRIVPLLTGQGPCPDANAAHLLLRKRPTSSRRRAWVLGTCPRAPR
jgi:hypothetical protein